MSFAPPAISLTHSASTGSSCTPFKRDRTGGTEVRHNVAGALLLLDNFVYGYRCASNELADGRQNFEVPSMLALTGGAVAAAIGAPASYAIATGSTAALFNGGKSYYDPQKKARIVRAAYDAVICMQNEAVGVSAYAQTQTPKPAGAIEIESADRSTVTVSPDEQYFRLVQGALLSVENVLAERLSSVGSYSPDAIINEIKAINQKIEDSQKPTTKSNVTVSATAAAQAQALSKGEETDPAKNPKVAAHIQAQLVLSELQPKLELCITRAKT